MHLQVWMCRVVHAHVEVRVACVRACARAYVRTEEAVEPVRTRFFRTLLPGLIDSALRDRTWRGGGRCKVGRWLGDDVVEMARVHR